MLTPFHILSPFSSWLPIFFEQVFAGEGETPPPEKQDRGPGLANEKIEAQRAQRRSSDLELVLSVLQEKNVCLTGGHGRMSHYSVLLAMGLVSR